MISLIRESEHKENLGDYSSISNESIINAISKITFDSASGPDGIPVILLKNCTSEPL